MKIRKILIGLISVLIIATLLLFTSAQNWFYKSASFNGQPLTENLALKNTEFTPEHFEKINNYIDENLKTTSIQVLKNGQIIYEYGDVSQISYIASCRKSVLSLLYGKYVENGVIDLNETIGALGIDEDDGLLPIEKEATIDHIITSRSGVFHIPANGGYDEKNIKKRGSKKPGEYFVYNNWDFNVAGYILETKSANSIYEEIEQQLAIPLGFEDWNIKNQSRTENEEKSRYSAYHIHISTRDMAKVGQLMLDKGKWNGEQLISEAWIDKITSTVTPVDVVNERDGNNTSTAVQFSYGYMWWLVEEFFENPNFEGAYTASGYGGQFITVIPKKNIVVAHKTQFDLTTLIGWRYNATTSWQYWELLNELIPNNTEK